MRRLKRILNCVGALAATVLLVTAGTSSAAQRGTSPGTVQVSNTPGLPENDRSSLYAVDVEGLTPSVYRTAPAPRTCPTGNCDGGDYARADHRTFNWASFRFAAGTTPVVTVTKTSAAAGTPTAVRVRGTGSWTVLGKDLGARTVRIRINRPNTKLSVEFVDARYDATRQLPLDGMLLFADDATPAVPAPRASAPHTYVVKSGTAFDAQKAAAASTVIFGRGIHDLGYWAVPSSVRRVHLAPGAYVRGAIDSATTDKASQQGFTVTGWGVLSGEQFPWRADKRTGGTTACSYDCWQYTVKMVQMGTDKFQLHDITVVNAPHWVVTGYRDDQITAAADDESTFSGTVAGIKVLGNWHWNGDGIAALPGTTVQNCFVSAFDDAFKLYGSHATVRDNTLWQMDNGAAFQLGWYGKTITDVRASRNTLLHAEWTGTNANWGVLDYAEAGGSGTISDVVVEGTRVMGPVTRVVALSNTSAAQTFQGIRLADTKVDKLFSADEINALRGNGSKDLPRNIVHQAKAPLQLKVDGLVIGGTTITRDNAAEAGGFDISGAPQLTFG
ncbi:hypothetical protein [Streptomyces sp. NPDC015414]|uniref:hypothetical protein n=1 Tax=Streptomyces sp. NPDC015414 TaxID=3364957 RepID=UPI0036FF0E96